MLKALALPDNPANQVYGTITVAALLAVESGRSETLWQAGGSVAVAVVALWLAHGYSGAVGRRFERGTEGALTVLAQALWVEVGILWGLTVPLVVLLVCAMAGVSDSSAVTAAFVSAVVVLVVIEVVAGLRSARRARDVAVEVTLSAVMGLAVLSLKAIVH